MTLADWIAETRENVRRHGVAAGGRMAALNFWEGVLVRAGKTWNFGESVYERDWDVLVVADACRPDLLAEVADEYEYTRGYDPAADVFTSAASMSSEWMEKNFGADRADEVARTAYVTGNPFSRDLDADRFALLDEVWRYGWDDEFGGIPPRPVTDRAIATAREGDYDRLIVHYMQPHVPFRSGEFDTGHTFDAIGDPEDHEKYVWYRLRDGEVDREAVWRAYRDNLRWVLDDVALLRSNLDADRVVLTADHGNALGEWGCWEHPPYAPVPALKRVPWVETTATDDGEYEPSTDRRDERVADDDIEQRLSALGYK
jgi:hypothetical protein